MIDVALLGTGGMIPLPNRFLTSLYCRINGRYIMIDCGEGTQISLKILGWGFKNIDVICLTHFHADHISGLPGILLTIGNSGRTEPVYIIGPSGTETIVKNLCVIASELPFELKIIEQNLLKGNVFHLDNYFINVLPVDHSINCVAYNICVPRKGKFNLSKALKLDLPHRFWSILQKGNTVEYKNKIYTPQMVLESDRKGIKISYCTDSRPVDELINFVHASDLFICEGIYGEEEKLSKAMANKHMIFSEAAKIASKAQVKELWLTHFSPSMPNPQLFLDSAKNIFENTVIATDRMHKTINFDS
jgi:ribonuclease Z